MQRQLEVLQEAEQYLKRFELGVYQIIEHLRNENIVKGYNLIGQLAEGLEWLLEVFKLTQEVQIEKIDIGSIQQTIIEMVEALENNDNNLIADLLEFEIVGKSQEWSRQINITLSNYENRG